MITVIAIALTVIVLYYLFSGKKETKDLPQITWNPPVVSTGNKREKVLEIVREKLDQAEKLKLETEAMQILSEILPSAQASSTTKAAK
jgi:hypothetical protein